MIVVWKALVCIAMATGCLGMSLLLDIAPLLPCALTAWGSLCFVFSGELSGAKRRVRNGIEEKPPLRIMWMIAGILCLLMAIGWIFTQV